MTTEPKLEAPFEGLFLSPTPPWGASVLVIRDGVEVLLLRKQGAWSPPAVTRLPDEPVFACGERALEELTGMRVELSPVQDVDPSWTVFTAHVTGSPLVELTDAYDAYEWVAIDHARDRCSELVSTTLGLVA